MKIEKVEKPLSNLHDKKEYVMHIRNSKQALNHGLVLKKVQRERERVIKSLSLIKQKNGQNHTLL